MKPTLTIKPLFCAAGIFAALPLTYGVPAQAQSPGASLAAILARLNADESKISSLQDTVRSQAATIQALQQKTAPITRSGTDLTFTGVNVLIENGAGITETTNGLGNLIIGYGENTGQTRTGSHNIVAGVYNNYTSFGGIVGGFGNTLSGGEAFAVGALNAASGVQSAVSGGISNAAKGNYSSVIGGSGNTAAAGSEIEPFGSFTTFNSRLSAVETKTAPITLSSDPNAGGTDTLLTFKGVNVQIVNGLGATNGEPDNPGDFTQPVVNGLGNLIVGYDEGTHSNRAGSHNLVIGAFNGYSSYGGLIAGNSNVVSGQYGVAFGINNQASGQFSAVTGGESNTASGNISSVSGGQFNTAQGNQSSVGGGSQNTAAGSFSTVGGGLLTTATSYDGWAAGLSNAQVTTYEGNFVSP